MNIVHKIEATESLLKIHFFQLISVSKEYEYPIIDEIGINEKYPGFLETFDFSKVKLDVLFQFIGYRRKWGFDNEYFDIIPAYFYYVWDNDNPSYDNISDWIIDSKKTNDTDLLSCPHPYLFTDFKISSDNDIIAVDYYHLILILNKKDEILYHFDKSYNECNCRLTFINEEYITIEASYFEDLRGDETELLKYANGTISKFFNKVNSIELFNLIIQNGVRLEIYHLSDELRSDKYIVLAVLKQNWLEICSLSDLNETLLSDKDFILEIININSDYFKYASEDLRSDREIVLEVVKNSSVSSAFKFCSKELSNDIEFIIESSKLDIKTIGLVDSDLISKHSELQELYKQYKSKVDNDELPF